MKILVILGIGLLWSVTATAQTCDIPTEYLNQTTVTENDLWIGFATDAYVYSPDATVEFFLVVKNIGTETFYLNWGIDPQDGIFVLPDSCPSIDSPGCLDDPPFFFPSFLSFYSAGTELEPGECRIWTESWPIAAAPWWTPVDGIYNVFGGMCRVSSDFVEVDFQVPAEGAMLNITIDSTVTGVWVNTTTWGRIKALYEE